MIGDRRQETINRKETGFDETNTRHETNKTQDKQDKQDKQDTRQTRHETGDRRQETREGDTRHET